MSWTTKQLGAMLELSNALPISAVERETGISKDVLRKWETRYGFPNPERDAHGERLYAPEQVLRLRQIKRMLDAGMRPGRVVPQTAVRSCELERVGATRVLASVSSVPGAALLVHLRTHDLTGLRQMLQRLLLSQGLRAFVLDTVVPLIQAVGAAWAAGELEIHEEHLFTEVLQGVLRGAQESLANVDGRPRVLLTTAPEESHGLGLQMVAALLALDGAHCVSLGTRTPMQDIANAALAHRSDIVALSFSIAYPARRIQPTLAELRARLSGHVAIWAGGAGTARRRVEVAGCELLPHLHDLPGALAAWRARQPA